MILALVFIPLVAGLAAFFVRDDRTRRALLLGTAISHSSLTVWAWAFPPGSTAGGWLAIDPIGLVFLGIVSALFLACSVYGVGYLAAERRGRHVEPEEGLFFVNEPEAIFTGCLLLFLASMSLATVSQHFGLLWVAIEGTTLASAPLIYFHRHRRSLEATWKYLLVCSVGIALALVGNFLLSVAASKGTDESTGLVLADLLRGGKDLHSAWLGGAFLFFLVGYGTKAGLAPLHTWLPDAYSESPSVVAALLSGALSNCAVLGILRAHQVLVGAGIGALSRQLLVFFGLFSIAVSCVFMIGQSNYRRLLAYSSVESMGILVFGVGLGGSAVYGAALHAVGASCAKAAMFLVAGNVLAAYGTKTIAGVRGISRALPVSGVLWVGGSLAMTGTLPFVPFLSEFAILKEALDQGRWAAATAFLALLSGIFVVIANRLPPMSQGLPAEGLGTERRPEPIWAVASPAILGLIVLGLGIFMPAPLNSVLHRAARCLGGQ